LVVSGGVLAVDLTKAAPRVSLSTVSVTSLKGASSSTTPTTIETTPTGLQHFSREIVIPPFNSSLLYDNDFEVINVNQSEVGSTIVTGWNSALGYPWNASNGVGVGQNMIVSLQEGPTTLANASGATAISPAWVISGCNTDRVAEVVYMKNGTFTDFYPQNATLVGDQVSLDGQAPLFPELNTLRLFSVVGSTQSYLGCSLEYTAGIFNEISAGWTYAFTHTGSYVLSYRFTEETLRQAANIYNPVLDGMILTSLQQNGRSVWNKLSTFQEHSPGENSTLARGSWMDGFMGMRLDQQYILFPQGSGTTPFLVSWNASGPVYMWITKNTLNGSYGANLIGPNGTSGNMTVEANPGVYWIIFFADDEGFVNGGYIQFDVQYPVGVNAVTYFEQASAYLY